MARNVNSRSVLGAVDFILTDLIKTIVFARWNQVTYTKNVSPNVLKSRHDEKDEQPLNKWHDSSILNEYVWGRMLNNCHPVAKAQPYPMHLRQYKNASLRHWRVQKMRYFSFRLVMHPISILTHRNVPTRLFWRSFWEIKGCIYAGNMNFHEHTGKSNLCIYSHYWDVYRSFLQIYVVFVLLNLNLGRWALHSSTGWFLV